MTWHVVRLEDVPATPWRNGGGVTRELAVWPQAADWTWRMSVAEVGQSGPFSTFDGVDRWFAVLAGSGVQLNVDKQTHHLTALDAPFFFDGAASTDCQLTDGATQDFNVMVQRSRASAHMMRVSGRLDAAVDTTVNTSKMIAIYAINAGATVLFNGETLHLPAASLAWRPVGQLASVRITASNALWMEITL
jgi:environmental stress-induced protein Ves